MAQDTFQQAKERYDEAQDAWRDQRGRMIEELRFSNPANPEQWDQKARQVRENGPDGARPCLVLDHTNQYIMQVVNDARQNKPAISFLPSAGGARQEVAAALDGIARHIEYQSRAQIAYDTAIEHAARCSIGWIRIVPEVVNEQLNYQEIRIKRVADPLSVVCDPSWTEPDGSDIEYGFVESRLSRTAFARRWGKKVEQADWSTALQDSGWLDDKSVRVCEYFERVQAKTQKLVIEMPDRTKRVVTEDEYWLTAKEIGTNPVLVAQYVGTEYKVLWRYMSGAEILEETEFPSCHIPLVPVIGNELWVEGKRYLAGMTRRMMEAQRAYNYERSAWVEAVALQPKAPMIAAAEAVEGHENEWARANKANLSYLPWNAFTEDGQALPMPQRSQPPAMPAAFAQGAQFADADIQASVGMYKANIGAPSNEKSGRAIMARQREGDTANFHYIDNLSRSIERVGRIVLDMIVRLYDEPREARILGQDGSAKPVRIDPKGDAYAIDGDVASINPSTGTYDVRVKAGPAYTTLRQEAAEGLTQMMQGNPAVAAVVAPIWARMQDWPEADKLSKALLAMAPPPVQAALAEGEEQQDVNQVKLHLQQVEQQAQQMQQMLEQASQRIQELESEDKSKTLEYLAKAAEIETREYEAETKRMQVLGAGMTPEQVQILVQQTVMQALNREPLADGEEFENLIQQQAGIQDEPHVPPLEMPEPGEPPEVNDEQNQGPSGPFSLGAEPEEPEPVE